MRNRFQPRPLHVLLVAVALLVSACLDGSEQISIRRDGSGSATLTYLVPTAAVIAEGGRDKLRREIVEWVDGEGRLRLDALEFTAEQDRTRIHIAISFDSALALVDLPSKEEINALPPAVRNLTGSLDFRLRGRRAELARTIDPRGALGGSLLLMRRGELAEHRLSYQITLPRPPASHNATTTRDDGRTLVWEYSLAEAIDEPPVMRFTAVLPLPWWLWPVAALPVAVVVLLAFALRRRLRGRQRRGSR